jgi:hypothetical protein
VAKADAAFRSVWEPAVSSPAPADRAAEIEKLRTENARMRHELEVMYGGAFDSLHSAQPADRAELRDRIMTALDNAHHTHPCPHTGRPYWLGCVHPDGGVGSCHTGRRADAVLSVLPAPAEAEFELRGTAEIRAAAFDEAAGKLGADYPPESGYDRGRAWVIEELRRLAGEARDERETQAEDPARIDRLRPEFTDHASIESIDVQIRRARSQLRRWHLRVEWLISLRQARVTQKELGEWPAAVSQPDHKPDAETQQPEAAEGAQQ